MFKKLITKFFIFLIDRDFLIDALNITSKNQIKGQYKLNAQILSEIEELRNQLNSFKVD